MAVDTATKRHSALTVPYGAPPLPDSTIETPDRLTLLGVYGGNASAVPAIDSWLTLTIRDRAHTATLADTGRNVGHRDRGHTATIREST